MSTKRGFTLIELGATAALLIVCAALVVPRLVQVKPAMEKADFIPSILRLFASARESSINQGIPLIVSIDSATNAVQITTNEYQNQNTPQPIDRVNAPLSGTPAAGSPTTTPTNDNLQFPGQALESVTMVGDASPTEFQLAGKDSSVAEFKLHFYPDGTCDSGGITFSMGNNQTSITIDHLGHAKVIDGPLPDVSTTLWEAGQLAQRTN